MTVPGAWAVSLSECGVNQRSCSSSTARKKTKRVFDCLKYLFLLHPLDSNRCPPRVTERRPSHLARGYVDHRGIPQITLYLEQSSLSGVGKIAAASALDTLRRSDLSGPLLPLLPFVWRVTYDLDLGLST